MYKREQKPLIVKEFLVFKKKEVLLKLFKIYQN